MTIQGAPSSGEVFYELTRSICPECRRSIDAKILLRDNQVYLRKRCPEHGLFEARIYGDAEAYVSAGRFNKPGTVPLQHSTAINHGCPADCGLCLDHAQHICVGIIEVNTACNMDCPLCFANAGAGFSLTLAEVEGILDHLVETEGQPEVVQFSGGEPTIHPQLLSMIEAAQARNVRHVMINTNGKRLASDDEFLAEIAALGPSLYFQFDGFEPGTCEALRGEPDLLPVKLRALDRLAEAGLSVILVPAIERGVNLHEVGRIVEFDLAHPAVRGINFQPAFHSGRHLTHDPLERITIPDVIQSIAEQTHGQFLSTDFIPVPCCFPTCNSVSYAFVSGSEVLPIARLIDMEQYLDYIANRVLPDKEEVRGALERLWSSAAVPGTPAFGEDVLQACTACGITGPQDLGSAADNLFHDHVAGLPGPLDVHTEERHEMLQGGSSAGWPPDPVLCLQHGRVPRAGANANSRMAPRRARRTDAIQPSESPQVKADSDTLKSCCAIAYGNPLVELILGEYWHPGGPVLSKRLGQSLELTPRDTVVDVASGLGATARLLAQTFGCRVAGVDYGEAQIARAQTLTENHGLSDLITFRRGDAESLPLEDRSVDAVVCECSLCTFPSAENAVRDWLRVLRPGGRVGLSDVTRRGALPQDLNNLAGWVGCLSGARSIDGCRDLLEGHGFRITTCEDRSGDLKNLVNRVGSALVAWLSFRAADAAVAAWTADSARDLMESIGRMIDQGDLGYCQITAVRV